MEEALEYFSVFGGLGWEIDTDLPLTVLIETVILDNYGHLYNQIAERTFGDPLYDAILSGVALSDRRTQTAFKHARVSQSVGEEAIDYLVQNALVVVEHSRESAPHKDYPAQKLKKEVEKHIISDKLNFTSPFLRFWFSFIAPQAKNIQEGNYEKLFENFERRGHGYSSLIFERLSAELLQHLSVTDPIVEISSYWDRQIEIDILAKTASGKVFVGECKYTNTNINKSEFTKLKEKCLHVNIKADTFAFFSKRGFSHELTSLQSNTLQLYTLDDFKQLLENITKEEKIAGFELP